MWDNWEEYSDDDNNKSLAFIERGGGEGESMSELVECTNQKGCK